MKSDNVNIDMETFTKQNAILMNLASKLNERDEAITHLNEELLAYDRITKESEENAQLKARRIDLLEAILRKNRIQIPPEEKRENCRQH